MELLTVNEALKVLRISRQSLYKLISEKKITVTKIGGRTLIDMKDIEEYVERSKIKAE
jgi:excisionase family DNA binding protein